LLQDLLRCKELVPLEMLPLEHHVFIAIWSALGRIRL
jgi:hypothetical protein